jgi:hypothetical protein
LLDFLEILHRFRPIAVPRGDFPGPQIEIDVAILVLAVVELDGEFEVFSRFSVVLLFDESPRQEIMGKVKILIIAKPLGFAVAESPEFGELVARSGVFFLTERDFAHIVLERGIVRITAFHDVVELLGGRVVLLFVVINVNEEGSRVTLGDVLLLGRSLQVIKPFGLVAVESQEAREEFEPARHVRRKIIENTQRHVSVFVLRILRDRLEHEVLGFLQGEPAAHLGTAVDELLRDVHVRIAEHDGLIDVFHVGFVSGERQIVGFLVIRQNLGIQRPSLVIDDLIPFRKHPAQQITGWVLRMGRDVRIDAAAGGTKIGVVNLSGHPGQSRRQGRIGNL